MTFTSHKTVRILFVLFGHTPLTWSIHKAFPVDRLGEPRDAPISFQDPVMVFESSDHYELHAYDVWLNLTPGRAIPARKEKSYALSMHHQIIP